MEVSFGMLCTGGWMGSLKNKKKKLVFLQGIDSSDIQL
jgi:hypothetical protein